VNKQQIKADAFRVLAHAAAMSAAASGLGHEREKFERAAGVWTKLADDEDRRGAARQVYLGRARAVASDASQEPTGGGMCGMDS
jgi:hypothetical protein